MATVSEPTMDQWETLSYEDRVTYLRKHGQSGGLDLTMDQWKTSIGQILGVNSEYKDRVIHIRKQGQSGGLELIRVENRNPVLIWTAQGELIRTHGEFRFVKDHILRQMSENPTWVP